MSDQPKADRMADDRLCPSWLIGWFATGVVLSLIGIVALCASALVHANALTDGAAVLLAIGAVSVALSLLLGLRVMVASAIIFLAATPAFALLWLRSMARTRQSRAGKSDEQHL